MTPAVQVDYKGMRMKSLFFFSAGVTLLTFGTGSATADDAKKPDGKPADAAKKLSFHRDIRPIMRVHCQGCHQPAKPGGKLVLTSYADLKKGGESNNPGFVPGKPDESPLLLQLISQNGQPPAMPKDKPALEEAEVAKIRQWIIEGAIDDTPPAERVAVDMEHPPTYTLPPVITSVDFSPDGKLLAVSGYHEVLLHKADGSGIEARLVGLSERIESAVFSPDGKLLAVTGGSPGRFGEVQIWDVAERKLKLSVNVGFDTLYGASWSPNGKMVAFGCPDNTVRAIDPDTGKQVLQQGAHNDWVLDTTFTLDNSHLISVGRDMTAKLTEVATQRFEDNITSITPGALKGGLMAVDIRPKTNPQMIDQIAVGGSDGAPAIFRVHRDKARVIGDDFNRLRTFEKLPGRVFTVKFSRDGSLLVAGSSYDDSQSGARLGDVRVFQAETGQRVSALADQKTAVYCATFSPDAKQVATGGFDGNVRLFETGTGKLIKSFSAAPMAK
jgi:WD40 repeat protein/mono/diheme cytochrome c family protein